MMKTISLTEDQIEKNFLCLLDQVSIVGTRHLIKRSEHGYSDFTPEDPLEKILLYFENDFLSEDGEIRYAGFKNAPAGKGVHHAYRGGLVEHLLEMLSLDSVLRSHTANSSNDQSLVYAGVVLHDLQKAYKRFSFDGATPIYSNDPLHSMLTQNQVTLWMLNSIGLSVTSVELLNIIYNSEGGYAKNPPTWCSDVAKYVYILDELSVNLIARPRQGNVLDVRQFAPIAEVS